MPKRSTALEKALAVLQAVVEQPQPVAAPYLVARLGLRRQTVHRVLIQLQRVGLLLREHSGERYSVGPQLSRLSFSALRSLNQTAPVRAILQDLVGTIGETCNVGVLDVFNYVYLQRVDCSWPLRVHLDIGTRVRAHWVSGGKLLLAHLDAGLRRQLLDSQALVASTPRTLTTVPDLESQFARIRTRGYALNNQEHMDGIVGAAVPLVDPAGNVLAAVGMHGPMPRLTLKMCQSHVPRMQAAAARIARVWCA
jgi:DNA-binding IclR family transcriptional regulator